MVLWGLVILPSLVRAARAPTRHQTQNPALGKKSPNAGFVTDEKWCRSGLEALVWLAVVEQVANAVHRVFE